MDSFEDRTLRGPRCGRGLRREWSSPMPWLLALLVCLFQACAPPADRADSSLPTIVATTGMIADVARVLMKEQGEVVALMGPQVDPHLYRPTRSDIQRLQSADLVLYSGLHLEGRMTRLFEELASRDLGSRPVRVVAVTESLDAAVLSIDPSGTQPDPHVWMDVSLWSQVSEAIARHLKDLVPKHAEQIDSRLATYLDSLRSLHSYGREVMQRVPEEHRVLVTSHDAFRYFGRAYGLEVRGIQGISTDSEPGMRDVDDLVALVCDRRVPAVFIESSVSSRSIEALVEGVRHRGHDLQIGAELYSDAMGALGTQEGTYLGMLDHNLTVVARALGADPAPTGWHRLQVTEHERPKE